MENLDALVTQAKLTAPHGRRKRPTAWLARNWDFLAVLLLIGASLPLAWISPRTLVVVRYPGTFDDHWVIDAAFKASRGIWFGATSYSSTVRWATGCFSAPSRWVGLSLGAIYTSYNTLLLWCSFLFGYADAAAPAPGTTGMEAFPAADPAVRFLGAVGRTDRLRHLSVRRRSCAAGMRCARSDSSPWRSDVGAAALTAVGFLYSADTGVYGVAAFLIASPEWRGRAVGIADELRAVRVCCAWHSPLSRWCLSSSSTP